MAVDSQSILLCNRLSLVFAFFLVLVVSANCLQITPEECNSFDVYECDHFCAPLQYDTTLSVNNEQKRCMPRDIYSCSDFKNEKFCSGAEILTSPTSLTYSTCSWNASSSICYNTTQSLFALCESEGRLYSSFCTEVTYVYIPRRSYRYLPATLFQCHQLPSENLCDSAQLFPPSSSASVQFYSICRWDHAEFRCSSTQHSYFDYCNSHCSSSSHCQYLGYAENKSEVCTPYVSKCSQLPTENLCQGATLSSSSSYYSHQFHYSGPTFTCKWCQDSLSCVFSATPCSSCAAYQTSNESAIPIPSKCQCEFQTSSLNCSSLGFCTWCDGLGVCLEENNTSSIDVCSSTSCSEFEYYAYETGNCLTSSCSYCYVNGTCWNNQVNNFVCSCGRLSSSQCSSAPGCTWQKKVVSGANYPHDYCGPAIQADANCPNPVTCSAVLVPGSVDTADSQVSVFPTLPLYELSSTNAAIVAKDLSQLCKAASCGGPSLTKKGNLACSNEVANSCSNFLLDGFIVQPLFLTALGLIKDVITLLLIGVYGDRVWRWIAKKTLKFKYWWKGWDVEKIKPNLDRTIYVNDFRYEDPKSENETHTVISFEDHCKLMIEKHFEVPQLEISEDEKKQKKHDEEFELNKKKLFDAVSFCFYSTGLWIDDEVEKQAESVENRDDQENIQSPREETVTPSSKLELTKEFVSSRAKLQTSVEQHITKLATSYVFIASSRSAKIRAACSLNTYPTSRQLALYVASIIVQVVLCSIHVLQEDSQRVLECSESSGGGAEFVWISNTDVSLSVVLFRFINSSVFATSILIFVKTVRGLWNSSAKRFYNELDLPQRLPLMTLYSSKAVWFLLMLYFSLGSLCFGGGVLLLLYLSHASEHVGAAFAIVGGITVFFSLFVLLNNLFLWCIRKCFAKNIHQATVAQPSDLVSNASELDSNIGERQPLLPETSGPRESTLAVFFDEENHRRQEAANEIRQEEIKQQEASSSVLHSAPRSMSQALLVFFFAEELPTLLLMLILQSYLNIIFFGLFTSDSIEVLFRGNYYDAAITMMQYLKDTPLYTATDTFSCLAYQYESSFSNAISFMSSFLPFS